MTYSNFDSRLRRSTPLPVFPPTPTARSTRKRKSKRRASVVKAAIAALLLLSCGAMAEDAGATLPGHQMMRSSSHVSGVTVAMLAAAGAATLFGTLQSFRRAVGV